MGTNFVHQPHSHPDLFLGEGVLALDPEIHAAELLPWLRAVAVRAKDSLRFEFLVRESDLKIPATSCACELVARHNSSLPSLQKP